MRKKSRLRTHKTKLKEFKKVQHSSKQFETMEIKSKTNPRFCFLFKSHFTASKSTLGRGSEVKSALPSPRT